MTVREAQQLERGDRYGHHANKQLRRQVAELQQENADLCRKLVEVEAELVRLQDVLRAASLCLAREQR